MFFLFFFQDIYFIYMFFYLSNKVTKFHIYIYMYFNPVKMDKENDKIDFRF